MAAKIPKQTLSDEPQMPVFAVLGRCVQAIRKGIPIERESLRDKEFHFQNWFRNRLDETGMHYEQGGRNSYPDFRLVEHTDGFELKGLAYPGRDASFDSNSQAPTGFHNGRVIYYAFGRYPALPDGNPGLTHQKCASFRPVFRVF